MPELIIIIIAVVAVFGAGKLPSIASWIGRKRSLARKGREPVAAASVIDITPEHRRGASNEAVHAPKPGTRSPGMEDARIEE